MEKSKKLAKIALAGLLLASHLPADIQAIETHLTGILLAVAGCPAHGCPGKTPNNHSPKREETPQNDKTVNSQVADAGGDLAVPRSPTTTGGGYSTLNRSSNVGGYYGVNAAPGSYVDSNIRGTNVGGSYGVPENRYGSSNDAGSWGGTPRPDIGRERVQGYNYSSYNTNRNFETGPNYQGNYIDSSFYSDTVAPYGAANTEGYDKSYNRSTGYGYEGITTSGIVTEPQLKSLVSVEGWNIYLQLDPEGKALALQLASQTNSSNKDLAIREAYVRMQERRSYMQKR